MTNEQILYAGITAVSAALLTVIGWLLAIAKILWRKSEECETDRIKMRTDIISLTAKSNLIQGQVDAMRACPSKECPMRRASDIQRQNFPAQ